ncbi:hypothetical protein BH23PLA1_BH23PLA1_44490 [soil metagenome]
MKKIDLSPTPPGIAQFLDQAREEDLLVRLDDGSEFLLVAVDDFEREIARTGNNSKLMVLLADRARQAETVSLNELKQRLSR